MAAKKFKVGSTVSVDNKDFILLESFTWKSSGGEKLTVGLIVDVSSGAGNIYDTKVVLLNRVGGEAEATAAEEATGTTTSEDSGQQSAD